MVFEYFIQVEHQKLSMPKAATIFAHSFLITMKKPRGIFPGKVCQKLVYIA